MERGGPGRVCPFPASSRPTSFDCGYITTLGQHPALFTTQGITNIVDKIRKDYETLSEAGLGNTLGNTDLVARCQVVASQGATVTNLVDYKALNSHLSALLVFPCGEEPSSHDGSQDLNPGLCSYCETRGKMVIFSCLIF